MKADCKLGVAPLYCPPITGIHSSEAATKQTAPSQTYFLYSFYFLAIAMPAPTRPPRAKHCPTYNCNSHKAFCEKKTQKNRNQNINDIRISEYKYKIYELTRQTHWTSSVNFVQPLDYHGGDIAFCIALKLCNKLPFLKCYSSKVHWFPSTLTILYRLMLCTQTNNL